MESLPNIRSRMSSRLGGNPIGHRKWDTFQFYRYANPILRKPWAHLDRTFRAVLSVTLCLY